MEVMTNHKFMDDDIEKVLFNSYEHIREIVLKMDSDNALLISQEDVVALAKEFGLVVFEEKSRL